MALVPATNFNSMYTYQCNLKIDLLYRIKADDEETSFIVRGFSDPHADELIMGWHRDDPGRHL